MAPLRGVDHFVLNHLDSEPVTPSVICIALFPTTGSNAALLFRVLGFLKFLGVLGIFDLWKTPFGLLLFLGLLGRFKLFPLFENPVSLSQHNPVFEDGRP
ncbi:hypothetical protein V8F06_012119 [Rhypophila decipiens]